ncbi:MAG: Cys-tRNA(Pro) deacylase [Mailhella sp.]|nr:Cys-tRNA(Pro) deacylase [Mailhella sp.]
MASLKKTNAARLLDRSGIHYQIASYPVDPDDLSATHAAAMLGVAPETVFKTLLVTGVPNGLAFAVIPACSELDMKKLALALGDKHVEMVPLADLLPLTGYVRGGCSPLGAKKKYPVCIDSSAQDLPAMFVSAGQRGMQLILAPNDLAQATDASFADITRDAAR